MRKITGFVLLGLIAFAGNVLADEEKTYTVNGNPIVRDIFTADPSARVWNINGEDVLYVYPSQDIKPAFGCDMMDKYHVFSTTDLETWTDHGEILSAAQVPWGVPINNAHEGATFMWAPDCVYKDGIYYFYFPHPYGPSWNDTWRIGIATSTHPGGPFTPLDTTLLGLPANGQIDPNIFIDDDGQAYFFYGGGGTCYGAKLKDNMIELDGELQRITGLNYFHEGAWLFKKDGVYYMTYPGNSEFMSGYVKGQDQLLYATSDSPMGPFKYKGSYLRPTGCDTSHGSVVKYKDQWYAFYHNIALSGQGNLRSICVDKLYFEDNGNIKVVKQTRDSGSPYAEAISLAIPGTIEAEDFNDGGNSFGYFDNTRGNSGQEYRTKEWVDINVNFNGDYYIFDTSNGEYMNYTVEVAETGKYTLEVIAASASSRLGSISLEWDNQKITNPVKYEVPEGSRTEFTTKATVENIQLEKGTHLLTVYVYGDLFIDKYNFTKQVGIQSVTENEISVYPNPSKDVFRLNNLPQDGTLSVFDLSGRQVYADTAVKSSYTLNLKNEPSGVYLLALRTPDQMHRIKLVKQ
ncbi:hypothetical protein AGMMS50262_04860 [Bacteroidia bacterium]|nr:hypothetical protein AGMMS50262_04860 [Bacteroidia bacterium]